VVDERLLDEHLRAENVHDLEAIMATYGNSPVVVIGAQTFSGHDAIRTFHARFGFGGEGSFSNVAVEERHRHRTAEAIVIEQTLRGVHTGPWQKLAPTGRSFAVPVCTVYTFDEHGLLAGERVYLDAALLRKQLTEDS
jgi:hypothetical protein